MMKNPFKKASISDLSAAVVAAEADENSAKREAEAAVAARDVALLDPDEDVALKADEDARRAVLRLDRAEARLAAARAALAEAEEVDRKAKVEAEHRRLLTENAALADRLTGFLATTTEAARSLIADLHRQREAVATFNASAPDGLRVLDPEDFRNTPPTAEEVLSEVVEKVWCKSATTVPVASQDAVRANEDGRTGWVRMPGGGSLSAVLRRVKKTIVIPGRPRTSVPHLCEQLVIPSLQWSYTPGWAPTKDFEVETALAEITKQPGEPTRQAPVERVVFLD